MGFGFDVRTSVVWILPSEVPKIIACKRVSVSCSMLDSVASHTDSLFLCILSITV